MLMMRLLCLLLLCWVLMVVDVAAGTVAGGWFGYAVLWVVAVDCVACCCCLIRVVRLFG